jgi:hypothetical protein
LSRTWKGVAAAARLALVATLLVTLQAQPGSAVPPDRATAEYTVASGDVAARAGAAMPAPAPLGPLGSLPEKLALVMVGGLLLGLAAAVRRTT